MSIYKENINYEPHNFNTSELLFNNEIKGESIVSMACELIEDETTIQSFSDGTAQAVIHPMKGATFTIEIADSSPTTSKLWNLRAAGNAFPISFSDANAPELKVNAQQCFFAKSPAVRRGTDVDIVEWTFVTPYAEMRGGSYKLLAIS